MSDTRLVSRLNLKCIHKIGVVALVFVAVKVGMTGDVHVQFADY